ncbi:hypothetical protein MSAN_00086700 [Mycena sanguinolenta]|uniref:F-box domain-containing protein n=1 Tax=Mycena sanguinolenta TaxID=230812 RepID=A0A8H6ZFD9_9AGAR|nr:hypothetical protein MSAN_00086700 [Mycena sanguinolenta]
MDSESVRRTTNYIPSDEEIKDIKLDIVSRSEELVRLDVRIRELSAKRDELQTHIDSQKALISHPRRLPADIIREIFIACLPTSRNAVMSAREAPLLLCRICSAWRRIALSAPRLWASLHVPFRFVIFKEPRILAVEQWLQRSGACPLSFSVSDMERWERADEGLPAAERDALSDRLRAVDALTTSLCAVAHRWRHATFDTMSVEMAYALTEIQSPLLESFEFSGKSSTLGQVKFFQVPSLRTVSLGIDLHDPQPLDEFVLRLPLIWDQLQHLTLTFGAGISMTTFITLLGRCPKLVSIHVTPFYGSVLHSFATKLTLPFLTSIGTSSYLEPRSLSHLISHTTFDLATLGKRSPLVEDLAIYLPSLTAQSLPETLQSFPSLTRLVVFDDNLAAWGLDSGGCTLTKLLVALSHIRTCPMLQELVIDNCSDDHLTKSTLEVFFQQRMKSSHRLQRFEVSFASSTETHFLSFISEPEIQSYLSQGLHISVLYKYTPREPDLPNPWMGLTSPDDVPEQVTLSRFERFTISSSTPMASPFASHLGTNYCPKDNELLDIQALLLEPTRRIQRLDDEIAELQKAIDKLAEERHSLQTFVDGYKALISPVRRLPLDIIQEIFVACIPTHRNCVMSASEAPVLLGRICSSWRTISLRMPRLWARLHIVEPPQGGFGSSAALIDQKAAQRLDMTKVWLGRSGECPLSISLQCGPKYDSPPLTPTTLQTQRGQILQELIPFAGRWQHIRFTAPSFMLESLTHLIAADVPMLESIMLLPHQLPFPPHVLNWEHFGLLGGLRLTSFSTAGSSFKPQSLRSLRWQQLTELTISGPAWESSMTSDMLLQLLSQCNRLRSCTLVVNDAGPPISGPAPHSPHPLVELPLLNTFRLDCSIACTVLDRLSLPQLRDFTLNGVYGHSLAPFFSLCFRLETLNIDTNSFNKTTMQESLCALPSTMLHLTIRDHNHGPTEFPPALDDDALALLTPTPGSSGAQVACPGLETLTITYCCMISDAALLRFITGRMVMTTPASENSDSVSSATSALKRVDIGFNRQMTLDIMPSLAPFIERGFVPILSYISAFHATPFALGGIGGCRRRWGSSAWGFNGSW